MKLKKEKCSWTIQSDTNLQFVQVCLVTVAKKPALTMSQKSEIKAWTLPVEATWWSAMSLLYRKLVFRNAFQKSYFLS